MFHIAEIVKRVMTQNPRGSPVIVMIMAYTTHQFVSNNVIQSAGRNASSTNYALPRPMEQVKDATNASQHAHVHLKEKASQEQIVKPRDTT
jgi:hypothetical protein